MICRWSKPTLTHLIVLLALNQAVVVFAVRAQDNKRQGDADHGRDATQEESRDSGQEAFRQLARSVLLRLGLDQSDCPEHMRGDSAAVEYCASSTMGLEQFKQKLDELLEPHPVSPQWAFWKSHFRRYWLPHPSVFAVRIEETGNERGELLIKFKDEETALPWCDPTSSDEWQTVLRPLMLDPASVSPDQLVKFEDDALSTGEIEYPSKIENLAIKPVYPEIARVARVGGRVLLIGKILTTGTVEELCLARVNRPNMGFEESALDAVGQWRYTPGKVDGEPVVVIMTVMVDFSLHYK